MHNGRRPQALSAGCRGTFFKTENIGGNLFDLQSDRVPMHATLRSQGLQHKHVERALQAIIAMLSHPRPIASYGKA